MSNTTNTISIQLPLPMYHQHSDHPGHSINDDERGSRYVSSPWYVYFSFFFYIYYCTNVYLSLNRLCVRPHQRLTSTRRHTSPPTPITSMCRHQRQRPQWCHVTTSTHRQHQHTTSTCPTTTQTTTRTATTTVATNDEKCPWHVLFFFVLSYYSDTTVEPLLTHTSRNP